IFKDLGVNLRAFMSKNNQLIRHIPSNDLALSNRQKVLGITGNSEDYKVLLSCKYRYKSELTKHSVAEQVAAIYDPLGWLTPLTKQF
ncbi:hypothetical protein Angca_000311, partial [Angiostrongylus cantonensis]